ncbi:low molecular weight phosphotyrosine protein phosphatase [Halobacillus fulvus]|nr:low molecular weight phosphotyrosine protein phosphatase [Halobacillus fulvus]
MINVLFVCLGNICRSPMAEAVFRDKVKKSGLENEIHVDSAGVGHWHVGSIPHEGTRELLDRKNISYQGMKARQITEKDWDQFDYLIVMDENNLHDVKVIREEEDVVIEKLMEFVPDVQTIDVPDPYFTGNFDHVFQLVDQGCEHLLEKIIKDHQLKEEL